MCDKIADNIKKDIGSVDVIVGISRGGLIPARILADRLDIHDLSVIRISFYKGINQTEKEPRLLQKISESLEGKRVLLVDDLSDSGTSLKAAIAYLKELKIAKIYTATLHVKTKSSFIPDFFVSRSDNWIVYPWEKVETERELIPK